MGLGTDGRIVSNEHFVCYNNKRSPDGAIEHGGNNLTGDGSGDDEVITVDVAAVPGDRPGLRIGAVGYRPGFRCDGLTAVRGLSQMGEALVR